MAGLRLFRLAVVAELVLRTLGTSMEAEIVAGAMVDAVHIVVETGEEVTAIFNTLVEDGIAVEDAFDALASAYALEVVPKVVREGESE